MIPDDTSGRRLIELKQNIAKRFTADNWLELGALAIGRLGSTPSERSRP